MTSADNTNITNGAASATIGHTPTKFFVDRGTGLIGTGDASTSIYMRIVNASTLAMSTVGTGTVAVAPLSMVATKGYVVVHGADGTLRSYSRSGAVLSQVDSVASGSGALASMEVSPYTGVIYVGGSVKKAYSISAAGALTSLGAIAWFDNTTNFQKLAFSSQKLPTV